MDKGALALALISLGITVLCQLLMGLQSVYAWLVRRKEAAAAEPGSSSGPSAAIHPVNGKGRLLHPT